MNKGNTVAFAAGAAIYAALAFTSTAQPQSEGSHKVVMPRDIQWGPAPAGLPAGAEAALLYGDPNKDGVFALRVKIPKDYYFPPHTHLQPEIVTILSGKLSLGMGAKVDRAATQPVGSGGLVTIEPGVPHYVFAEEETTLQITSTGPWGISYVDPKDDPRLNIAPRGDSGSSNRID